VAARKKGKPQHFNCKNWGHIRKHRPTYNKTDGTTKINVDYAVDSKYEVLVSVRELFDEVCVLNTGSSYHVASNKEWFATYKPSDFEAVYQVDGVPRRIMGIGDIKIKPSRW
jgi:hypothetical protein